MTTLQTGLQLKHLIDNISSLTKCIGRCVSLEEEFQRGEDEVEDEDTKRKNPILFLHTFREQFTAEHVIDTNADEGDALLADGILVSLHGEKEEQIRLKDLLLFDDAELNTYLKHLFELGVPSPYGKVDTMETVVDESVRSAKEIPLRVGGDSAVEQQQPQLACSFSVSDQMLTCVEGL